MDNVILDLQLCAAKSPMAARLFQHLATMKYDRKVTTVRRLMCVLKLKRPERPVLVRLLRDLEGFGVGDFVAGRRNAPSRFVWAVPPSSVGRAAVAEDVEDAAAEDAAEDVAEDVEDADAEDVADRTVREHFLRIRPGLQLMVELPDDLTSEECGRLASFLAHVTREVYDGGA